MKSVIFWFASMIVAMSAAGQGVGTDGDWIKSSIDAFDRVNNRTAKNDDFLEAMSLLAFVSGMLAVHQENNTKAVLIFEASKRDKELSEDRQGERTKTMLLFTPLLTVPGQVSAPQIVAILRRYLDANPGKWKEPAHKLITDAFADAFPRR